MEATSSFLKQLKSVDSELVCYWNKFKGCWMIDRRTEGGQTTNVLTCTSEDGEALPLNDNLLDRLRSMDSWKKHGTYEAFHRFNIQQEVEANAKIEADIRENYRLAGLDDKIQLNRAHTLIQRHDTARINQ
jgi:hypothetical protein